jgi:excisionase family DNA binding protein
MSPVEVTVIGVSYWANNPQQLAQLLATSTAPTIRDPTGQPVDPNEIVVFTRPDLWAEIPTDLRNALASAASESGALERGPRHASGAAGPVEDRLVFTVEEAAQLLGISRSFAYEAVERGEIPSMRIGRRILVPKIALERFLSQAQPSLDSPDES